MQTKKQHHEISAALLAGTLPGASIDAAQERKWYEEHEEKKSKDALLAKKQYESGRESRRRSNRYDSDAAAEYLGYSPATLRNSRSSGLLAGVQGPPYIKIGLRVYYLQSALDEWLAQFAEQTCASDDKAA